MPRTRSASSARTGRSRLESMPTLRSGRWQARRSSPTPSARTPASGSCVAEHFLEQSPENRPHFHREMLAEAEGRLLLGVDRLGKLELDGVDAVCRVAVGARDVAALEAAVQYFRVARDLREQRLAEAFAA